MAFGKSWMSITMISLKEYRRRQDANEFPKEAKLSPKVLGYPDSPYYPRQRYRLTE